MTDPNLPEDLKWLGPDPPGQAIPHSKAHDLNRPRTRVTKASDSETNSSEDERFEIHPIIRQIIDRDCHVGLPDSDVIRHVVSKLRGGYEAFRTAALEDRESFIKQCISQHRANQRLYVEVMSGLQLTKPPKLATVRPPLMMSGMEVASLMRKHKVSIRELSARSGITMKRIREVRTQGIDRPSVVRDWLQIISGVDPGPIPEMCEFRSGEGRDDCKLCGYPFRTRDRIFLELGEKYCSVSCCRRDHNWWE